MNTDNVQSPLIITIRKAAIVDRGGKSMIVNRARRRRDYQSRLYKPNHTAAPPQSRDR
jgi:hypothetical protein